MLPMTWPLLKMIWHIHFNLRPNLVELVNRFQENKKVFHITSKKELRLFIQQYCL